ncbi:MAG: TauD/TfdA family dioxygenase, partial [Planctomycetes bacterium]|nr:TauD/TfdA family dioxygenase [Planctomycetota bacterium]
MTSIAPPPSASSTRRWTASTLAERGSWRRDVPAAVADEFLALTARRPELTADEFEWQPTELPQLAAFGARLCDDLLDGYGLCRLRGLAALGLTPAQQRTFYFAIGSAIGEPMLQYGRLYPVQDRGKSYTQEAVPVSMTNSETCFHTDSSSIDAIPDFVGLLCEQPSDQGGDSLVSNALRVHDTLRREAPDVLAILSRPWI